MNEDDSTSERLPMPWKPRIGSFEWYSRWAIDTMEPAADHTDEYKELYRRLQDEVKAADMCFQRGYELYIELSRMGHEGTV